MSQQHCLREFNERLRCWAPTRHIFFRSFSVDLLQLASNCARLLVVQISSPLHSNVILRSFGCVFLCSVFPLRTTTCLRSQLYCAILLLNILGMENRREWVVRFLSFPSCTVLPSGRDCRHDRLTTNGAQQKCNWLLPTYFITPLLPTSQYFVFEGNDEIWWKSKKRVWNLKMK